MNVTLEEDTEYRRWCKIGIVMILVVFAASFYFSQTIVTYAGWSWGIRVIFTFCAVTFSLVFYGINWAAGAMNISTPRMAIFDKKPSLWKNVVYAAIIVMLVLFFCGVYANSYVSSTPPSGSITPICVSVTTSTSTIVIISNSQTTTQFTTHTISSNSTAVYWNGWKCNGIFG